MIKLFARMYKASKNFTKVFNAAKKSGHVLIAGHHNPDGDTIGACFALALAFAQKGITPVVLLEPFSERFGFLRGAEYIYNGDIDALNGDILICVDCAAKDRLGKPQGLIDRVKTVVSIDHHDSADDPPFADINIVDGLAAATCELLYFLINPIFKITPDIAAALYTGIVTDTGCFRHKSTSPRTYDAAARLLERGIDFNMIQRRVVYEHSPTEAAIFAAAIGGMNILSDIKLAVTALSYELMTSAGAVSTDLEGIADYMLNTRGAEVSALLTERKPGIINISLRSTGLNVREIARKLNGGGHVHAAGGSVRGSIEEVTELVIKMIGEANGTYKAGDCLHIQAFGNDQPRCSI
ncbi:MAG: DHH family phosphoesterase [Defluviitaleaceae bacterium]|nr:DHH family phosphoesterase [Defluviitaleaceae bacterium]MCL2837123.1 DHH family phosphoesterase [Defluviitaleaceae bacterium]